MTFAAAFGLSIRAASKRYGEVVAQCVSRRPGRHPLGSRNPRAMEARRPHADGLCRRSFTDIEKLLGRAAVPEMIHRTNLVLTH
jgi:hypothetical protein